MFPAVFFAVLCLILVASMIGLWFAKTSYGKLFCVIWLSITIGPVGRTLSEVLQPVLQYLGLS
jgi:hypothetical protein